MRASAAARQVYFTMLVNNAGWPIDRPSGVRPPRAQQVGRRRVLSPAHLSCVTPPRPPRCAGGPLPVPFLVSAAARRAGCASSNFTRGPGPASPEGTPDAGTRPRRTTGDHSWSGPCHEALASGRFPVTRILPVPHAQPPRNRAGPTGLVPTCPFVLLPLNRGISTRDALLFADSAGALSSAVPRRDQG